MISSLVEHPWLTKAASAVVVAMVLGGGTTLLQNNVTLAKMEEKIETLEALRVDLYETNRQLTVLARDIAVLVDRSNRDERERKQ